MTIRKINWDALGITTSIACAIHCALLPLVFASLPVLGINIIHNPGFEYGMIGLAFAIGTGALRHGFRRHHQRLAPWLLFSGGILFLLAKQVWHQYELRLLPFAIILIVSAHILNFRLSRRPFSPRPAPPQPPGAPVSDSPNSIIPPLES